MPSSLLRLDREQWLETAQHLRASGASLLTLWGSDDRDRDLGFRIAAAYLLPDTVVVVEHLIAETSAPFYPSIAGLFPAASRMQRAVHDLLGISSGEPDTRNWLRHGGWPETFFPLRRDADGSKQFPVVSEPYPFVAVEGDGVHEISVGPVHAGTIEPGNFRFSVV